jgi:hypothetical protein
MATLQGDTAPDTALLNSATGMLNRNQTTFGPAMGERLAALKDTSADRGYLTSQASADTAQQMGRPGFAGMGRSPAFGAALNRGRALAKITSFGDNATATQNLQDRIAALKVGRGIRSGAFTSMSAQSSNALQLQEAQQQADMIHRNANANAVGTAGGMAIRGGMQYMNQPAPTTDWKLSGGVDVSSIDVGNFANIQGNQPWQVSANQPNLVGADGATLPGAGGWFGNSWAQPTATPNWWTN